MTEPRIIETPSGLVPESAIEAVTAVVRDLFRYPCADPQTSGATQELIECGACAACTRDWTPEAEAILAAAVPHIERAIRDRIADKIEAMPTRRGQLDALRSPQAVRREAARVARGGEATE
jgi:hypothetical protein